MRSTPFFSLTNFSGWPGWRAEMRQLQLQLDARANPNAERLRAASNALYAMDKLVVDGEPTELQQIERELVRIQAVRITAELSDSPDRPIFRGGVGFPVGYNKATREARSRVGLEFLKIQDQIEKRANEAYNRHYAALVALMDQRARPTETSFDDLNNAMAEADARWKEAAERFWEADRLAIRYRLPRRSRTAQGRLHALVQWNAKNLLQIKGCESESASARILKSVRAAVEAWGKDHDVDIEFSVENIADASYAVIVDPPHTARAYLVTSGILRILRHELELAVEEIGCQPKHGDAPKPRFYDPFSVVEGTGKA